MNQLIGRVTGDDNDSGDVNVGAINVVLLVSENTLFSNALYI